MNVVYAADSQMIIPDGVGISDMMKMFDAGKTETSAAMQWRWALLEMAADTLQLVHDDGRAESQTIWKDEGRLRAGGLLQLALVDSYRLALSRIGSKECKINLRQVARLAHCYRVLQNGSLSGSRPCDNFLRDAVLGLIAAYRPVVRNFDIQLSLLPVLLRCDQRRGLALFINSITQGVLERACLRGGGGRIRLMLAPADALSASLKMEISDPIAAIYESASYQLASRIASNLEANVVCKHDGQNGALLELIFATNSMQLPSEMIA
jgi:hypothetical protein